MVFAATFGPLARDTDYLRVVSVEARISCINLSLSDDLTSALVVGNPVYEAGGAVEIRRLPKD